MTILFNNAGIIGAHPAFGNPEATAASFIEKYFEPVTHEDFNNVLGICYFHNLTSFGWFLMTAVPPDYISHQCGRALLAQFCILTAVGSLEKFFSK